MRHLPTSPRQTLAVRAAIVGAGVLLLGIGWRLTSAEPASAAIAQPEDASDTSTVAPADYVPEDNSPIPATTDPLGRIDQTPASDGPTAPLDFLRVTSSFGMRRHPILGFSRMHQGVDFAAKEGAPVLAAADGVVTQAGPEGGYGNLLRIRHAGGWATGYAHLSSFAPGVRPGMAVTRGEVVAFVGHTGLATGPHLHYEVSFNGVKLDPMQTPFGGAPADDPHAGAYRAAYVDVAPTPSPTGPATLRGPLRTDIPGA
ncbi:MAG TPA: M23 family metallopeptidase [Caulobacteraceae bacterium]|nr:M23 family metallopeptidase [Caulobacteraceae bacterium]